MNYLESELKTIIANTTQEYADIATRDPTIKSSDDGTIRGDDLDALLSQQEAERKALWDRLYQLEKERVEKDKHVVIGPYESPERKQLLKLMNLDLRLNRKVNLEMQKVNVIEQPEETLIELQFREKLSEQIQQFKKTIEILRGEIKQVTHAVSRETVVLKECQDIGKSLIQREQLLRQEKSVNRDTAAELRLKLASIQREYDLDMKDMTEFLDDNYPVHVVDGQGPLGDECELKIILEQLLNRAYQHPENPYLPLVPGTYWSPYVQTLVGAGIARYHPNDINRLRLENFKE